MYRKNFPDRKTQRREEAVKRQEKHDNGGCKCKPGTCKLTR